MCGNIRAGTNKILYCVSVSQITNINLKYLDTGLEKARHTLMLFFFFLDLYYRYRADYNVTVSLSVTCSLLLCSEQHRATCFIADHSHSVFQFRVCQCNITAEVTLSLTAHNKQPKLCWKIHDFVWFCIAVALGEIASLGLVSATHKTGTP